MGTGWWLDWAWEGSIIGSTNACCILFPFPDQINTSQLRLVPAILLVQVRVDLLQLWGKEINVLLPQGDILPVKLICKMQQHLLETASGMFR